MKVLLLQTNNLKYSFCSLILQTSQRVSPPRLQTGFMADCRRGVISASGSPCSDVDVLSALILQMQIGSGLDRSSPKHLLRCLAGRRTEEELGQLFDYLSSKPPCLLKETKVSSTPDLARSFFWIILLPRNRSHTPSLLFRWATSLHHSTEVACRQLLNHNQYI